MLCVFVRFHIKPECREQFIALAGNCIRETRKEPGNISYDMGPERIGENVFTFFERWKDQESVDWHESRPYFLAFDKAVGAMMDGKVEVFKIDPLEF